MKEDKKQHIFSHEFQKRLAEIGEKFEQRRAIKVISEFSSRFDEIGKRLYRIERLLTELKIKSEFEKLQPSLAEMREEDRPNLGYLKTHKFEICRDEKGKKFFFCPNCDTGQAKIMRLGLSCKQ